MFFYSPNQRPLSFRQHALAPQHLHIGQLDSRLSVQIAELLSRVATQAAGARGDEPLNEEPEDAHLSAGAALEVGASPTSPAFSAVESRRTSRAGKLLLRRPTVSIQDDGRIVIGSFISMLRSSSFNACFSWTCFKISRCDKRAFLRDVKARNHSYEQIEALIPLGHAGGQCAIECHFWLTLNLQVLFTWWTLANLW